MPCGANLMILEHLDFKHGPQNRTAYGFNGHLTPKKKEKKSKETPQHAHTQKIIQQRLQSTKNALDWGPQPQNHYTLRPGQYLWTQKMSHRDKHLQRHQTMTK